MGLELSGRESVPFSKRLQRAPSPLSPHEGGHSTKPAASEPDTESASALNVNPGLRDFKQHVVVVHEHQPLVL